MSTIIGRVLTSGGMSSGGGICVLIVGGGGREHSLAISMVSSSSVREVHLCPGNAGTGMIANNHPVSASDIPALVSVAQNIAADLVIIGPEDPLVEGLANSLRSLGISCFGPDSDNAMLEGSKMRAKEVMSMNGVPSADYQLLSEGSDIEAALDRYSADPWVVKRDVLAAGKGVLVSADRKQARAAIQQAIESDGQVMLEAFLAGEEASMLVLMDESGFVCLPASQDHKRLSEGDSGPNTGGMGAYAPAPVVTEEVRLKILQRIVQPMHDYLSNTAVPYRGVLYVGLMIDSANNPNVVEFNVRFGDPECQVTLPLVESDMAQHLLAVAEGRLASEQVSFLDAHCLTVVVAAEGYPGPAVKGRPITGAGLEVKQMESEGESWLIHAATEVREGRLLSSGGRVLCATGLGSSLTLAAKAAYQLVDGIELQGSHHRRDIGHRAL